VAVEIAGVVSVECGATGQAQEVLQGKTRNIASGGIGITGDRPLTPGTVLRCEVAVQDVPARIPTLVKVCWSDKSGVGGQYKLGLLFLL
jgi:hypothetical protein